MTPDVVATGLTHIAGTHSKFSYFKSNTNIGGVSYAFTKLNLENKNVQDLTDCIGNYKHLRDINLSHNDIKDISEVQRLDHLVNLQASHNKIDAIDFFAEAYHSLQYLQVTAPFFQLFNRYCI